VANLLKETTMALNQVLANNIANYAKMSEDALLAELGQCLQTMQTEASQKTILSAADPAMPVQAQKLAGPILDKVKGLALDFLGRFNKELYRLMCDKTDPDNQKLRAAFAAGQVTASAYVGALLLATFAWLPGIVAIVAGMIVRRFILAAAGTAYDQVCTNWGKELGVIK
jgi:hypothetical protein